MEHIELIAIFLFVLFLLLGTGVWVGLALLGVAFFGMELFTSRPVGDAMITTIWSASSSWTLTALPLFIWMGEILFRTRLSEDMFKGLTPWMAGLPGGLIHTNIVGCTVFAAVSGSSAATLTTVGKMSIPELRRRNYPEHMIIGTLAGAATLGLMIPPSLTLIGLWRDHQRIDLEALHCGRAARVGSRRHVHELCGDLFQGVAQLQTGCGAQDELYPENRQLAVSDPGDLSDSRCDWIHVSRFRDRNRSGGLRRHRGRWFWRPAKNR